MGLFELAVAFLFILLILIYDVARQSNKQLAGLKEQNERIIKLLEQQNGIQDGNTENTKDTKNIEDTESEGITAEEGSSKEK